MKNKKLYTMGMLIILLLAFTGCQNNTVDYVDSTAGDTTQETTVTDGKGSLQEQLQVTEEVWEEKVDVQSAEGNAITYDVQASVKVPDVKKMYVLKAELLTYTPEMKKQLLDDFRDAGSDIYQVTVQEESGCIEYICQEQVATTYDAQHFWVYRDDMKYYVHFCDEATKMNDVWISLVDDSDVVAGEHVWIERELGYSLITDYTRNTGWEKSVAQEVATACIQDMGFVDYEPIYSQKLIAGEHISDGNDAMWQCGYTIGYIRTIDGVPVYGADNITVSVTENGITDITYQTPLQIGEQLTDNALLLSYSDVKASFRNSMVELGKNFWCSDNWTNTVKKIELAYGLFMDEQWQLAVLPVWNLQPYQDQQGMLIFDTTINATDGSSVAIYAEIWRNGYDDKSNSELFLE